MNVTLIWKCSCKLGTCPNYRLLMAIVFTAQYWQIQFLTKQQSWTYTAYDPWLSPAGLFLTLVHFCFAQLRLVVVLFQGVLHLSVDFINSFPLFAVGLRIFRHYRLAGTSLVSPINFYCIILIELSYKDECAVQWNTLIYKNGKL